MPIQKDSGRQMLEVATLVVNFGDPATPGTAENAIELPPGAVVTGGDINVDTAFNSTTNTITLGDVTTPTRYASALNLQTPGRQALTLTGFKTTPAQRFIQANLAFTGAAPTAGSVRINVQYIVTGRAQFGWGQDKTK